MAGQIGGARKAELVAAHIPSWLRMRLYEAAQRRNGQTYADVGFHLAMYHPDDFGLEENGLSEVTDDEIDTQPTRTLRRLFRSEEHPRGEFVDLIPPKQRKEFLRGLCQGITGDPFPEGDV